MPGNLFRSLFARPAPASPDVASALEDLKRLRQERPGLAAHADLMTDLLPRVFDQPSPLPAPPLDPDLAAAKLTGGVPLLRGESLNLDLHDLGRRWQAACASLQKHRAGDDAQKLADAARLGSLDLGELAQAAVAGHVDHVHTRGEALALDPILVAMLLRLVLLPSLAGLGGWAARLGAATGWQQGFCPVCGSWPLLGEFRGLDQTRFLRCGLCAAGWEVPRLRCPFCANHDHRQLGFLHFENEEARQRAATCEACRGYVKTVATLAALSPPQLLAADVATMPLDLAAAEQGYVTGGM